MNNSKRGFFSKPALKNTNNVDYQVSVKEKIYGMI
jgi:hypothetical protein